MFKTGAVMSIMLCEMAYNNLTLTIETWAPTALADRFALCVWPQTAAPSRGLLASLLLPCLPGCCCHVWMKSTCLPSSSLPLPARPTSDATLRAARRSPVQVGSLLAAPQAIRTFGGFAVAALESLLLRRGVGV